MDEDTQKTRAGTQAAPTAVVVAYGHPEQLRTCLESLGGITKIIIVDNSRLDEIRVLAERHGAEYIEPARNIGFAAAVNLALAATAGSTDVLLVNPDAIVSPETIQRLVHALHASNKLAAVAPLLVGLDGSPQRPAWPVPSPRGVWLDALGLKRVRRREPHFLVGAVLLLNRQALTELGGFDERFFLYAEETDWQLRALRAGWQTRVVTDATARHIGGGTSDDPWRRELLFHRSAAAFGRKWYGASGWALMWVGSVVGACLRGALHRGSRGDEARRLLRIYLHRLPRGVEPPA